MGEKTRILVVEPDAALLRQLEAAIKLVGAEPTCLSSGRDAAIIANKKKFEGAFIDWDTPEFGGEQLTKMIRRSKSNSTIPIAMLTSNADTKAIAAGFKAGATFFLAKPFGAQEITRLLNVSRGAMLEERRRYLRVPVKMGVLCKWGGKTLTGHSVDISASGLLMTLAPPPEMGAKLALEFELPRSRKAIEVDAEVTRVDAGHHIAVRFLKLTPEQREEIMKYTSRGTSGSETSY